MKRLLAIFLTVQMLLLTACSASSGSVKTKDVEIYGTTYTIPEDWYIEREEKSTYIYLQKEKPESIRDAIFITQIPGVMENGSMYYQSEQYIALLKGSIAKSLFDKLTDEKTV